MKLRALFACGGLAAALLVFQGCARADSAPNGAPKGAAAEAAADPLSSLSDAPVSPDAVWLYAQAFSAVSKMPLVPHLKNRSRAQDAVLTAMVEEGQLRSALERAGAVANWRQGLCYARIARALAARGDSAGARALLERAEEARVTAVAAEEQDWRAERLLAAITEVRYQLGEVDAAQQAEAAIGAAELARVAAAKVQRLAPEDFDAQLRELRRLAATGDFDQTNNALEVAVALHGRFYDDEVRRARLEGWIAEAWQPLPIDRRLAVLERLVTVARARGGAARMASRVEELAAAVDAAQWTPELGVGIDALVARLQHSVGQSESALRRLAVAQERYERERDRIYDVFRASALRPLAEAYAVVGQADVARSVLRQALEEGARNPNAKPRAEDLAATCCSMARCFGALEAADRARIEQIAQGLTAPW